MGISFLLFKCFFEHFDSFSPFDQACNYYMKCVLYNYKYMQKISSLKGGGGAPTKPFVSITHILNSRNSAFNPYFNQCEKWFSADTSRAEPTSFTRGKCSAFETFI